MGLEVYGVRVVGFVVVEGVGGCSASLGMSGRLLSKVRSSKLACLCNCTLAGSEEMRFFAFAGRLESPLVH